MSKEEYWAAMSLLKSRANPIVPDRMPGDPILKHAVMEERLELALKLIDSGMAKRKAARTAHIGEDRLYRRLRELEKLENE